MNNKYKKFMLILFPICFDKWEEIDNMIENSLSVIKKREVELSDRKKFELIYDLYRGENWIGSKNNNWEGINYKMNSCFINENKTVKFYYVFSDEKSVRKLKERIRELCNCGNHSIHSTDFEETANELKTKYFK